MPKITEFEKQVNQRAANVFNNLLENKTVKNKSELAIRLKMYAHTLKRIYDDVQTIQNTQIEILMKDFGVNVNYLFCKSDEMFEPTVLQSKINLVIE